MEKGVTFKLSDGVVCASCDGTISLISETLHAFNIVGRNGIEIFGAYWFRHCRAKWTRF
ncbi:PTS glucose transporter subunit IIA [Enterococcus sp. DIV0800]|uniref:PTS glucose transporter subunit IIA n=1 Tax=unclassified Enterococcus TaxID=2608891 RepID=UPI003D2FEA98